MTRRQRLFAAAEVEAAGWGALKIVSEITGLARSVPDVDPGSIADRTISTQLIWHRDRCAVPAVVAAR